MIGAVFAGPWVGVAMAIVGWALFFPLVASSHASSVLALPRAPVATIHGLVGVLRTRTKAEDPILPSIEDETDRLRRSPLFEGE